MNNQGKAATPAQENQASIDKLAHALLYMFLAILSGPVMGALGGWVVSFVFDDAIHVALRAFGVVGQLELWQLGAFLGFVGAFIRR